VPHVISEYKEFDKDNNSTGSLLIDFNFEKDDKNKCYYFHSIYTYTGNKIDDDIVSLETTITTKDDSNLYQKDISTNGSEVVTTFVNYETVYSTSVSVFYTNDNTYKNGGLFYGDYFSANASKYSYYYKIDNEDLTFKCEDELNYYKGASLDQELTIDNKGMLIYCDETMTIIDSKDYATQKIEANYNVD